MWPSVKWKSVLGGREMDSEGRRGGMAVDEGNGVCVYCAVDALRAVVGQASKQRACGAARRKSEVGRRMGERRNCRRSRSQAV